MAASVFFVFARTVAREDANSVDEVLMRSKALWPSSVETNGVRSPVRRVVNKALMVEGKIITEATRDNAV